MAKMESINQEMREIFSKSIADGYKKHHICALTLGSQSVPQFDGFVKGRDFAGTRPLERIFDAFGFELHIVPVAKDDKVSQQKLDGMTEETLSTISELLTTSLDTEAFKSKATKSSPIFKEVGDEIRKQLGIIVS